MAMVQVQLQRALSTQRRHRPDRPWLCSLIVVALFFASCGVTSLAQQPADAHPPTFKINVNRVLVPVVVRDTRGHAVGDLEEQDFRVFDNGKVRPISAFMLEQFGTTGDTTPRGEQLSSSATVAPQAPVLPARITVLLFDDVHMGPAEIINARNAAEKVLAGALTGSDVAAVVSISGRVNSGLTRDRTQLQEAMMKLQPQGALPGRRA